MILDLSKPEGHPERLMEIPLTQEEIAQAELDATAAEAVKAQHEAEQQKRAEAKASAESKLAALGLTPEEVAAIVGA